MITKEKLLTQIETYKKTRDQYIKLIEQHQANMSAVSGAIMDCEFWIKELDKDPAIPGEADGREEKA